MGTWVHGYAICDFTRDLIYENLKSSMDLKYVSVGDLRQVVSNAAMSSNVPFVLVRIAEPSPQDVTTFQQLETGYQVRIVYVRQFADDEEIGKERMQAIETIANYLQDSANKFHGNAGSGNLSLTAGDVTNMRLNGMEYDPPENEILAEAGKQDLVASACNVLVIAQSDGV